MLNMKKLLPGGGEPLVNYDYVDIADGTGIQTFYGFNHKETTTISYALGSQVIYSNDINTSVVVADADFTQKLDLDFDLYFNKPKRIKGKARATFTMLGGNTAPNYGGEMYVIIKLRKYSNSVETEIANAQSETLVFASTEQLYNTCNVQIDISSNVNFKKGDILRATIEVWGKKTGSLSPTLVFYHDPKNGTAGTALTTQFILLIPFILDT